MYGWRFDAISCSTCFSEMAAEMVRAPLETRNCLRSTLTAQGRGRPKVSTGKGRPGSEGSRV